MKILDCTLRDGGYYTNWDFDRDTVDNYLSSMNELPIEYLEVGYRSIPLEGYLGEYFYLPVSTLKRLKKQSNKKFAIILNEKDIRPNHLKNLLGPCNPYVDMVRIAIDPANFARSLTLAKEVKDMGFEVAFNVMYMSNWDKHPQMWELLPELKDVVDYFYMVDSFGGVYPEDVRRITRKLQKVLSLPLGFHGHNNIEMALINTLVAIEEGVEIVDATISGMGRGAGNLKTELLLTALNAKGEIELNYNALVKTLDDFSNLQESYKWGTNLPYMVSGANSLPQKQVMEWVSKRFYSFNSIVRALDNISQGKKDNERLPLFNIVELCNTVLIVGGGTSINDHAEAIQSFLNNWGKTDIAIIHASSKNAANFSSIDIAQYFCLVGNEGYRLESILGEKEFKGKCILPPYPRKMGTYLPSYVRESAFELPDVSSSDKFTDSHTALALEVSLRLGAKQIFFVGYDGYSGDISTKEKELYLENEYMFNFFSQKTGLTLTSLTPTEYKGLELDSLYKWI